MRIGRNYEFRYVLYKPEEVIGKLGEGARAAGMFFESRGSGRFWSFALSSGSGFAGALGAVFYGEAREGRYETVIEGRFGLNKLIKNVYYDSECRPAAFYTGRPVVRNAGRKRDFFLAGRNPYRVYSVRGGTYCPRVRFFT